MNILYETDKEIDLVITNGCFAWLDSYCIDKLYELCLSNVEIYDDEVCVDISFDNTFKVLTTTGSIFVISMENLVKLIDEFEIDKHDPDDGIGEFSDKQYKSDLLYLPKFMGQINMVGNFDDDNWVNFHNDDDIFKCTFCQLIFKGVDSASFEETRNRLINGLEFVRLQKMIKTLLVLLNKKEKNKYLMMEIIKVEYQNITEYNIFNLLS